MPTLSVSTKSLVTKTKPHPPTVGAAPNLLQQTGRPELVATASALEAVQDSLTALHSALRNNSTVVDKIAVVDTATGKVIAALGDFIFAGVPTTNYFNEIHVGDPLNTGDPSQALFVAANGKVTIGQNGWLDVLDPYGADAAWIGTQFDTQAVTGAANNGSGLIRLTVVGHTLATGDVVRVLNVGGVPNATGIRTVTKINADHFDLQSTVFVGAYTSGGTVDRLLHVTGAVNNGAGLIRLTVAGHGFESGDKTNVQTVGGVPNATGQWIVTVITVNTFDLVGSTFAGAFTSGGTVLRYFAGGLFQTMAVGSSFANYKLRAFSDGSLRIKNAIIDLSSAAGEIIIDPSVPSITVTSTSTTDVTTIDPVNGFQQTDGTATFQAVSGLASAFNAAYQSRMWPGTIQVIDTASGNTRVGSLDVDVSGGGATIGGSLSLYDVAGAYRVVAKTISGHGVICLDGPVTQVLSRARLSLNSAATPADSHVSIQANSLGAFTVLCYAADNVKIAFDADWVAGAWVAKHAGVVVNLKNGSKLQWLGSTGNVVGSAPTFNTLGVLDLSNGRWGFGNVAAPAYSVDAEVDVNAGGVFRKGGAAGLSVSRSFGTSLTVNTSAVGVVGVPGVGQANATVVTGVTLNLTANTWSGGIITA